MKLRPGTSMTIYEGGNVEQVTVVGQGLHRLHTTTEMVCMFFVGAGTAVIAYCVFLLIR